MSSRIEIICPKCNSLVLYKSLGSILSWESSDWEWAEKEREKDYQKEYTCKNCGYKFIPTKETLGYDLDEKMICEKCGCKFYRWRYYRCPKCDYPH